MEKTGLILEGGGFRGIYTSGVLDYFMEHDLYIPQVYGVSAGACNALGYAAKQPGRSAKMNFDFCDDKRYMSYSNMLKVHGLFNMQFIFEEIPMKLLPFDYRTFFESEIQIHVGVTNLLTGKCQFYTKDQMDWRMFPVRASSALPLVSHIYYLKHNTPSLDGGVSNPIPIRESINSGNSKNIIVLTQDPTYEKKVSAQLGLVRRIYKDYPNFVDTVAHRHVIYNRQRKVCRLLEKTGQAIVIQPQDPVRIRNIKADRESLQELYAIGYEDARRNFDRIRAFIEK